MEFSVADQTITFLFTSLLGFFAGIIYDFYKAVNNKTNNKFHTITDILFSITVAVISFIFLFNFNGFEVRLFNLFGFVIGVIVYFLTISSMVFRILKKFIDFFVKIFNFLLYPIKFLCIIIYRILNFFTKKIKKIFKKLNLLFNSVKNSIVKLIKRTRKI